MLSVPGDLRLWLQTAAFVLLALAAWRFGGGPERILAAVLVWFRLGDAANHALFAAADIARLNLGHVMIDVVALAVAVTVALFANRMYPLWFAAFQLLAVFAHLAREMAPGVAPLAYGIMYIGPSYFQIFLLAGGIWLHHRRVRRYGPYRSWRNFSPRSPAMTRSGWPGS
jgi:voltage-gated potassium channel Kch